MSLPEATKQQASAASSDTAHLFLKEVKKQTLKDKGKIDYRKLRKDGYSESTIERLKLIRPTA
ncbi:MAG: hypothetical protein JWM68_5854 [Verrucomicrobiales bacterium]|nr:hypothetical protein [Verrucomicrobiales bacterium]